MSYTQRYQQTITLRKTVPVRFDYTDSKGNKNSVTKQELVEISEELYFNVNVNTDPFDNSVGNCGAHVSNLKKAIVATESAEVASKVSNSVKLGKTLGKGFIQLICTNMEMQAKDEQAKIKSLSLTLQEQSKDLLCIKGVMKDDYDTISQRYTNIFQNLDRELKSRIQALNKDTFGLIQQSNQTLSRNMETALMATTLIGHKENTQLQTALCASSMKQKAQQLIQNAFRYISGTIGLYQQIQRDLTDEKITIRKTKMVPILYTETKDEKSGIISELHNNELLRRQGVSDYLLKQKFQSQPLTWKEMDTSTSGSIAFYMDKKIAEYSQNNMHEKRVSDMIRSLWQQKQPLVLSTK